MAVAGAYTFHEGLIRVDVDENRAGGSHVHFWVPATTVSAGLRLAPRHCLEDAAAKARPFLPMLREIAKELDKLTFPGTQGGPLVHTIAAKAVCLKEAMEPGFQEYQVQVAANAKAMAAAVAAKGFRLVSGGTDNHLFLIEVHPRGITGSEAEKALDRAGITVNKNAIPFDPLPPMKAGGIRLGSPAVTTRGMKEREMQLIGGWVAEVLSNVGNATVEQRVRQQVADLAARFPIYQSRLRSTAAHARI